MPPDPYILWTQRGLSCRVGRSAEGWQVSVEAQGGTPFLRRFAHSRGDAGNQAEYLRLLLDRSQTAARRPRDRQPLVLIVEDDAENRIAYEELLKMEGFRTAAAPTLAEARRLLSEITPAAILLDHALPDGDGTTFARELRAAGLDPAIPLVLVTGFDPAAIAPGSGEGPDALLGKPCRPEALTDVLKLLVRRAAPRRKGARPAVSVARLVRAQCPVCGIPGALVDHAGRFHCQQCGKEGRMDPSLYADVHS